VHLRLALADESWEELVSDLQIIVNKGKLMLRHSPGINT
jgi:hypothetical protein